ncbi:MAG: MFS transporter [Anaerolineales bacterium]|nr:MFS transporter [Anaerolineales bacterium]
MARPARLRLRYQLILFAAVRTVFNTGHRLVYPFLPVIARGLGVDLQTAALAVSARSMLGIFGPAIGSAGDRLGRRRAMVTSLVMLGIGFALVAPFPIYLVFALALGIASVAKILFDSSMQAYLGDLVLYARRGLAIAVTEIGWSLASLVGLPLVGLIMARSGWAAAFPWIAALALGGALALRFVLPIDTRAMATRMRVSQGLRVVARHRIALAALAVGLLISTANEVVTIVFGAWLEQAFALQIVALGAASMVIGAAELAGEGLVAGITDRLGKVRSVAFGILLNTLSAVLLPLLGQSLPGAAVGLFLFYVTFEFTLVSAIPLMTELVPTARATMMASNISSHALGRALGALLGPALFALGFTANGLAAAGLNLLALLLLVLYVRE